MISIHDLSYAYQRRASDNEPDWVLEQISLHVAQGEFVSIMGPPGAGKSTLCLALSGIVPQSTGGVIKGSVNIAGFDTKSEPVHRLAHIVGLVFENPESQLFHRTVEAEVAFGPENLGLAPATIRRRVDRSLERMGITELRQRSPFELSGGEMQRVAIAAILAMDPKVLVLDEPSAHLDMRGRSLIYAALQGLRAEGERTIIMVENRADFVAEFSDRVVVLRDGSVARIAPPSELFVSEQDCRDLGLVPPQVTQIGQCLADRLGGDATFITIEEAFDALSSGMQA